MKKKISSVAKTERKYSMAGNVAFMVRAAWDTRKTVRLLCALVALVTVGKTVTEMLVAPLLLGVIEDGGTLLQLLKFIGLCALLLALLWGAERYLNENTIWGRVEVRTGIIARIRQKLTTTAYSNTLDTRFVEARTAADQATQSNRAATEALWTTYC